jgi:phage repressor protein C with HTH and peptisase S24 domain
MNINMNNTKHQQPVHGNGSRFERFLSRICGVTGIRSQAELAGLLGVDRSAVTQAKKKDLVPEKWVLKLFRTFGLNPDWIESGMGDPYLVSEGGGEFVRIPKVMARLSAGGGSFEHGAEVEEFYSFRRDWLQRKGDPKHMSLMEVVGNSMEPEIREGDCVLVNESVRDILAGAVYAVGVEDTVMVKRVERHPGKLVLISDNTDYSPIYLQGDEMDSVRIIGKVIWVCRELG